MKKVISAIEKAEYFLMVVGILLSVCVLFLQVVLRGLATLRVVTISLPWVEELGRYLFILFTWIGTSLAARSGQHIRVEVLLNKFPKAKPVLEVICSVVCFAVCAMMLWYGIELVQTLQRNSALSPTMRIPMWICYSIIPLAGALMSVKYIYVIVENIKACVHREEAA